MRPGETDTQSRPEAAPGTDEQRFLDLHAERSTLERALALSQARQRFVSDRTEAESARQEEERLLADLDLVLTRIRAEEYRRRPGARRW
ncbi:MULTISPECIES: hypothetical protein [Methylobacterium]|uniref:Uncharacterized protein n=1 Tax=Methylobacterium jeotgali TaxID=381630 RepID=A0ABQ4SZW0_9HYPH|nr:hypothetical protein AwMethylo_40700 [Methylobacterium sp.]GJE08023.1 hypothetical protein AOPFMNJM_3355 [Methylobacterium jeotgali]